ncbi:hairy/enhancer-of-split related with YRPW motif protein 1-like [Arapaima gigas]
MKRNYEYSSSDSELEVEGQRVRENGSPCSPQGSVSVPASCRARARKLRRGVIEKRRRDRINSSLAELRKLVPSTSDRQGSAKLEKAEILQMTVDHLKMLHTAGGKGYLDARALAVDYRSLGFRECLAETARYLSAVEGLGITDPLQTRLVSHLSGCASQREAQSGFGHLAWGSVFAAPSSHLIHPSVVQPQRRVALRRTHSPPSSTSPDSRASEQLGGAARGPRNSGVSSASVLTSVSPVTAVPLPFSPFPLISSLVRSQGAPLASLGKPCKPWATEIGAF